jgi:AcrR family transcriptional regulator
MDTGPEDESTLERGRILRAGSRLIGQGGTTQTTVEDVLRAAGVNRRIFYRHFRSKDELVLALVHQAADRLEAGLARVVAEQPDPAAALAAYIEHMLGVGWDERRQRDGRAIMSPEVTATAGFAATIEAIHTEQRDLLRSVVDRGIADGTFAATADSDTLAFAVQATLVRYLEARLVASRTLDFDAVRARVTDLFLGALGVSPAGQRAPALG